MSLLDDINANLDEMLKGETDPARIKAIAETKAKVEASKAESKKLADRCEELSEGYKKAILGQVLAPKGTAEESGADPIPHPVILDDIIKNVLSKKEGK